MQGRNTRLPLVRVGTHRVHTDERLDYNWTWTMHSGQPGADGYEKVLEMEELQVGMGLPVSLFISLCFK